MPKPCIILSACKGQHDYDDAVATRCLRASLKAEGVPFKQVKGYWKGQAEDSFVAVPRFGTQDEEFIRRLASHYRQETILHLTNQRIGLLEDLVTGEMTRIGYWREWQSKVMPLPDSYTESEGRIYVCC